VSGSIKIKSADDLKAMRRSGRLLAATFEVVRGMIRPGVAAIDLDRAAERFIRKGGGIPAFLGYRGYPSSLCVSFNEQVVHGIPGSRKLTEGDLVGIDCGAVLDGFVSDMAESFYVGGAPPVEIENLMEATRKSLEAGIERWVAGNRVGDVSNAVQQVAESSGFSVVRALVGHGVGRELHEEPQVPNFGRAGTGPEIRNGMTVAIEPMVNAGTYRVAHLKDGWTVVTMDGRLSCHFEHTVAATADGPAILTLP
jgi:methionyl aminopeptidase